MTNKGATYSKPGFYRSLMVVLAIVGLLLSSCAVKYNVKSLLGLQHSSQQAHHVAKQNGVLLNSANAGSCLFNLPAEVTWVQQAGFHDSGKILAAFACYSFYFFLLGILLGGQKVRSSVFSDESRYPGAVPIFLQYRKLII